MKDNLQIIINACFVISITAFIYQNNAQQERIEALEKQLIVHEAQGHPFIIPPPQETLESCLAKLPAGSGEGIEDCWNRYKDK